MTGRPRACTEPPWAALSRQSNAPATTRSWPPEQEQEFALLWATDMTTRDIGDHFGLSNGTITYHAKRLGLGPKPNKKSRRPSGKPRPSRHAKSTGCKIPWREAFGDRTRCQWIDGTDDERLICGEKVWEGSPYCEGHEAMSRAKREAA